MKKTFDVDNVGELEDYLGFKLEFTDPVDSHSQYTFRV